VFGVDATRVVRTRRRQRKDRLESKPDAASALDELRARVQHVEALVTAADDRVDALPHVDDTDRRRRLGHLAELLAAARLAATDAVNLGERLAAALVARRAARRRPG